MTRARSYFVVLSVLMLLCGVAAGWIYLVLDLEGFLKGLCLGGSLSLIVGATYVGARYAWLGRDPGGVERATWLPSRDREGRS